MKDGNGGRAVKAAGGSPNAASRRAKVWKNIPAVKEQIDKALKASGERAVYNLQAAMADAEATIEFARETGNANAMAKAVELKSKLNGLLIEKHDVRQVGFQIEMKGLRDVLSEPVLPVALPPPLVDDEDPLA